MSHRAPWQASPSSQDDRIPPSTTEVLIVGGGPAGLEAALAARERGFETTLLEAGRIGSCINEWQHVRLFSPWKYNRSDRGVSTLIELGEIVPDDEALPTGAEFLEQYLRPITRSSSLRDCIYEHTRVVSAARRDTLKGDLIGNPERGDVPFRVLWETASAGNDKNGIAEGIIDCRYLIDASGVYHTPNWCGTGGGAAPGERVAESWITRHLPDPVGHDRGRFSGKKILVVGSGYSAATCVRDLTRLARQTSRTFIDWVMRSEDGQLPDIVDDPLPERQAIRSEVNALAADPPSFLRMWPGNVVDAFDFGEVRIRNLGSGLVERLFVDEVVSLTGYHPDPAILQELQVHHCYATDGLMNLSAALLSQDSGGDCLAVESAPSQTLRNPEPGLFVIGSKSYGRFSQYLLRSGIEQVEAIFTDLLPAPLR